MLDHPQELDPDAAAILQTTLAAVRRERLRRRITLAVLCPLAVALVSLIAFRPDPPQGAVVELLAPAAWSPAPPSRLAVLVMRNGTPTLESISTEAFGEMEIRLSLDPITSDIALFDEAPMLPLWPLP